MKARIKIQSDRTRWTLDVTATVKYDAETDQLCIEDVTVEPVSGAYMLMWNSLGQKWLPFDLDEYGGDDLGADVRDRFDDEIFEEIQRLWTVENVR